MNCLKCGLSVDQGHIGKKCFACDYCKNPVCEKCAKGLFTETEIRSLQLKTGRVISYLCKQCTDGVLGDRLKFEARINKAMDTFTNKVVSTIKNEFSKLMEEKLGEVQAKLDGFSKMKDIVDGLADEIAVIRTEVAEKQFVKERGSYADKLKNRESQTLVIRPRAKDAQDGTKTRKEVKTVVDPCELGIGIAKLKGIRDGGIAVSCENDGDRRILKNEVERKLGQQYEVKEVSKWKPRLKVVGIEEDLPEEDLKQCIIKQNSFIRNDSDLKIKVVKKTKSGFMAILEVDAELFRSIMDHGKLKIKWNICKVFECLDILRCYQCLGFNHKSVDCRSVKGNVQVCAACGGDHKERDCKSKEMRCINCVRANEKLGLKLDINHKAFDRECTVLMKQLERRRERIDYHK